MLIKTTGVLIRAYVFIFNRTVYDLSFSVGGFDGVAVSASSNSTSCKHIEKWECNDDISSSTHNVVVLTDSITMRRVG